MNARRADFFIPFTALIIVSGLTSIFNASAITHLYPLEWRNSTPGTELPTRHYLRDSQLGQAVWQMSTNLDRHSIGTSPVHASAHANYALGEEKGVVRWSFLRAEPPR